MIEIKATETRTALGIAVGAVTVVAVVTARIGPTTAAVISKTRRRNRHKTKAVVTSHGSRSRPTIAARSAKAGISTVSKLIRSLYAPGDGASAGSNAGTSRRFSRRAGIAR